MANRIPQTPAACGRALFGFFALSLVVAVAGCRASETDAAPVSRTPDTTAVARASLSIDSADFAARVQFLASDRLQGRSTPSAGLNIAADYIASEFATLGLEPGGDRGTFMQWYDVETDRGTERAPNVIGILRGGDPQLRDTWVVYSAHMDHVGVGAPDARGDSIYNGADDDASGTTAVIEIAEAFAALPERPARSVIFVTVSGEEIGLFGSRAFVQSGPVKADAMIANINIDMIGRNSPDTLVAIGLEYSTLGDRARAIAATHPELKLAVVKDLWPDERFFFRSDHYNFARRGVPAVFFFSGVHEDYHQPSDEAHKIDAEKASRIARLAFLLGLEIAGSTEKPSWTAEGRAALQAAGR